MKSAFVTALLAVLWLASAQAQHGSLPVQLPELEKIARADSNDATAHYNLGLGYLAAKRYAKADSAFRRSIALDSRFAPAYLARAYLPYAERASLWVEISEARVPAGWAPRLEESRKLYRRAFMLDPMVDLRIVGFVVPGFDDFRDSGYESAFLRLDRMIGEWASTAERKATRVPDYMLWYHGSPLPTSTGTTRRSRI
jgi:tetratricopeptide (TPR) repeat protein